MAIAISGLPAGTTIAGTEVGPGVQSSATVKFTYNQVRTFINPLTAKGDISCYSTANTKLGVGANGTLLTATSGATTGLAWTSPTTNILPKRGKATLSSGAATVTEATVTANSLIFLTNIKLGTVLTAKAVAVTAIVASTNFVITSEDATDTSDIAWILYEPTS
jgi:hypothetical protein